MDNKTSRQFWFKRIISLIILLAPCICMANPIAFPSWSPDKSNFPLAMTINSITDLIVIIGVLAVMGEWADTDKFTFSCFMILMIIGGFIIDFLSIGLTNLLTLSVAAMMRITTSFGDVFFISSFIMLLVYNYLLSERFLELPAQKRLFLGLAVAICTNPAYYYFFTERGGF